VRAAVAAGVEYRDRVEVTAGMLKALHADIRGRRLGAPADSWRASLEIPSGLHRTHTNAGLLFSHFDGVRLFPEVRSGLPAGPYPDDWAACTTL